MEDTGTTKICNTFNSLCNLPGSIRIPHPPRNGTELSSSICHFLKSSATLDYYKACRLIQSRPPCRASCHMIGNLGRSSFADTTESGSSGHSATSTAHPCLYQQRTEKKQSDKTPDSARTRRGKSVIRWWRTIMLPCNVCAACWGKHFKRQANHE
jgi:hypothetical protein